ncbi:hypothetical protein [Desertivirga arenae]|uniref:hypothetical protein n=1 Tax=Desertivirga arenae TaxID=2810309 RepID=UPI001A96DBB8|nr:hypothetical protein [Pedobacter sp. SYSU D00823]
MKPLYIYLITVAVLLGVLNFGNNLFKLKHDKTKVYRLQNFKLKDSVIIDDAFVYTGKNIYGVQEAILIPGPKSIDHYMYLYVRFSPEWFEANMKKKLKPGNPPANPDKGLQQFSAVLKWHKTNLKRFWHINEFPMIAPENEVMVLRKEAHGGDLKEFVL